MPKQYIDPGVLEFDTTIKTNQIRPTSSTWLDFPHDLKTTFGVGNLVPYKAIFDDRVEYTGSLAMRGGPKAMILLRKDVRRALAKKPGDMVHVNLTLDTSKREVELPAEVKQTFLAANVLNYFDKLPFSHQREHWQYINEAKKPETRQNRINKVVEQLKNKQGWCYWSKIAF